MFTYSPSAINSFASTLALSKIDPIHYKIVKGCMDKVKQHAEGLGFDLGLLANAYSEAADLKGLFEMFPEYEIYSDSGGLQALTLGKDLQKEKPNIFKVQQESSNWAMCFDEMPMQVLEERKDSAHSMLDHSGRYYVRELIKPKGEHTGRNVQEQINIFKKNKSEAKIMVILQGYGMNELDEFARAVYSQINEEDYDYIGGLAFGMIGNAGPFHLVDRIARYQFEMDYIPDEHKRHLHLLAAGGPSKLLGYTSFPAEYWKFKPKTFKINADSTSQSSSSTYGKFTTMGEAGKKSFQTGKYYNGTASLLVKDIYNFVSPIFAENDFEISLEEFKNTYTIFNKERRLTKKDYGESEECILRYKKVLHGNRFFWFIHELKVFFDILKWAEAGHFSKVYSDKGNIRAAGILRNITSYEQYMKVRPMLERILHKEVVPIIDSISDVKNNVLDEWL